VNNAPLWLGLLPLLQNVYDAVDGCLSIDLDNVELSPDDQVLEIAV
jgi:hypothetical protein